MGKYGPPRFTVRNGKFAVHDSEDKRASSLLKSGVAWLTRDLPKFLKKEDTDLLNIRDEILADLNQALFLFRLR
jgi:hypothetical protein